MAKILLAEDDVSMRQFLTAALERHAHKVVSVPDGLSALREFEEGRTYDLLLADIVMPGIDGIELSRRVSDICPDIKVMFITGFAAMALGALNPGGNHARVLSKPFHLSELIGQIDTVLDA